MDLFEYNRSLQGGKEAPLAARMRPSCLEDFVGQEHIVGKGKLLYRAIQSDRLSSVIFYGPPGTGKTTLAKIIANTTKSKFCQINATTAGIKEIKETVEDAKAELGMYGKKTILFIDEIHRFNKSQQDALLPHVEDGTLILIGATTENPYFEVNKALVSRSIVFELRQLEDKDVRNEMLGFIFQQYNLLPRLNLIKEKYGEDPDIKYHPQIRSAEACAYSSSLAIRLAKENNDNHQ